MKNLIEKIKNAGFDCAELSTYIKNSSTKSEAHDKLSVMLETLKNSASKLNSVVTFMLCVSCLHFVLTQDLTHMKVYLKWIDILP